VLLDGELSERSSPHRVLPDGSTLESWLAVMRLLLCRDGIEQMRRDSEIALNGLGADSGFRGATTFFEAMSYLLDDDPDSADPLFARAAIYGAKMVRPTTTMAAIAERGFIACERREWAAAQEFAEQALSVAEGSGLEGYSERGLPLVLAARCAVHSGDRQVAAELVTRATRLRPLFTYSRPAISLRTLFELARVQVALEDASGARAVLRQTRDILTQRPNLGTLPAHLDKLRSRLETTPPGQRTATSLTTAELRLLPYLPLYLTFPQIGERLSVSRFTVKSQAISIYQKLGVSSRGGAVERLQEIGLLDT
jgi:LuxR family maltose regulon positive regulatory protein